MATGRTMTYEGPFGIQIISVLAKFSQDNIDASEQAREKFYRIFIELAQNVALYSFNRVPLSNGTTIGQGKVYITEEKQEIQCVTINEIQKEHGAILDANCAEINQSNMYALRNKKRKLHRQAEFKDTGAHIGLIMISIYSGNPLQYEIINDTMNNKIYFKILATIYKGNFDKND
jgi:Family of unknown function (DUF6272)